MVREMISRAAHVAILADSSKFGRRLFAQVSELSAADYLITDTTPPTELRDALAGSAQLSAVGSGLPPHRASSRPGPISIK